MHHIAHVPQRPDEPEDAAPSLRLPRRQRTQNNAHDDDKSRPQAAEPSPPAAPTMPSDLPMAPSDIDVTEDRPLPDPDAIIHAHANDVQLEKPRLSTEMKNAFLSFRQSPAGQRAPAVALAMTKLMRIRLAYPRQIAGMAELEEMRLFGLGQRGGPQLGLSLFERTGCGKSTLAEQYKLMINSEAPEKTKPVIHARMSASGSAREMWVNVMAELDDGFASAGNETTLRSRAMRAMQEADVQMLIIDETQHTGNKTGFSREVTAELKLLLDTGRVPIVLLGTETAVPMIKADDEFAGRLFSPCHLAPLVMDNDDDFELWTNLLAELDQRLVSDGILDEPVGLSNPDLADTLGEATDGIIGQLMRVMLMAVRNVARDQRKVMTMQDLSDAVDSWSIALNFAKSNPLREL
ncbi:TniB family NTP-binding protein [Novosphingobium terrae]|uniref:TniB family NTP-binding protein n=1 Tax=Novosphingobium terrae TaxID=2726189 RepID=UPI001F1408DD|nr:TniB family NTP-binding protein [Novosphingobium terrae]